MKRKEGKGPAAAKIKGAELIVYDFDGVLTDNTVIIDETGRESVVVNRADGLAIGLLQAAGIRQVILTTETNGVVDARAKKLGIPVIRGGLTGKREALSALCREQAVDLKNVVYVGNDINDLAAMQVVGHPICPADAAEEVKAVSRIRLGVPGGAGVARSLFEHIVLNEKSGRK